MRRGVLCCDVNTLNMIDQTFFFHTLQLGCTSSFRSLCYGNVLLCVAQVLLYFFVIICIESLMIYYWHYIIDILLFQNLISYIFSFRWHEATTRRWREQKKNLVNSSRTSIKCKFYITIPFIASNSYLQFIQSF